MRNGWRQVARGADIRRGHVTRLRVGDADLAAWRGADGRVRVVDVE